MEAGEYPPETLSIFGMRRVLQSGGTQSAELVGKYLARIAEFNPHLHAVISVNPEARHAATAADVDRAAGRTTGPLAGYSDSY